MKLIENLNWRYATKRMEKKTVTSKKLDYGCEESGKEPNSFKTPSVLAAKEPKQ